MHSLETLARDRIRTSGAARVAVSALAWDGTAFLAIDADAVFHAASTMKIAVLVELLRAAEAGHHDLTDSLVVHATFASIVDGCRYGLDPADDSETALYGRDGQEVNLLELATLMVTQSSNLATNLLVELLGAEWISATMTALGLPQLAVLRGVEDAPAFAAGRNNTVTADALARLLGAMLLGELISPAVSATLIEILAQQAFNEGIPAGLPAGSRVAHKTGSIRRLYHDAAIVWPPDGVPFVLVVLTEGLDEDAEAPALAADIARLVATSGCGHQDPG
jgi:beta-lactamase class A